MNVAILGAGNVGRALGACFAKAGHTVFYAGRKPEGDVRSFQEAADAADVLLLTTPHNAAVDVLKGIQGIEGKIVVDVTNPVNQTFSGMDHEDGFSGAERIQRAFPSIKVIKAFNQTGVENLANPSGSMMFVAGNDKDAIETVARLSRDIGFDTHVLHDLALAKTLEQLAWLWIHYAIRERQQRNFAFHLVIEDER